MQVLLFVEASFIICWCKFHYFLMQVYYFYMQVYYLYMQVYYLHMQVSLFVYASLFFAYASFIISWCKFLYFLMQVYYLYMQVYYLLMQVSLFVDASFIICWYKFHYWLMQVSLFVDASFIICWCKFHCLLMQVSLFLDASFIICWCKYFIISWCKLNFNLFCSNLITIVYYNQQHFLNLANYLSILIFIFLYIYLSIYFSIYLSHCCDSGPWKSLNCELPVSLSIYLSLRLSIYRTIKLSVYLSLYLPQCVKISGTVKNFKLFAVHTEYHFIRYIKFVFDKRKAKNIKIKIRKSKDIVNIITYIFSCLNFDSLTLEIDGNLAIFVVRGGVDTLN